MIEYSAAAGEVAINRREIDVTPFLRDAAISRHVEVGDDIKRRTVSPSGLRSSREPKEASFLDTDDLDSVGQEILIRTMVMTVDDGAGAYLAGDVVYDGKAELMCRRCLVTDKNVRAQ